VSTPGGQLFEERPTGLLLRLAHQRSRAVANHALRVLDLDVRHVGVLAVLAARGQQTQRQLVEAVELDKSSMVYVVARLERDGLVARHRSPVDRRTYEITVTELGRRRLADAVRIGTAVMGELLEPLSHQEERQLNDMLTRIIEQARKHRGARTP
jgi:DNA-binding MarR family transcriptional regulator